MIVQQKIVRRQARRAFTLMEVLVVVAIIVILASIATVSFRYLSDSKESACYARIKAVETAVVSYKAKHTEFPPSLQALTQRTDNAEAYLDEEAIYDPWGNVFNYDPGSLSPTGKPSISSQGDPTKPKTISNW